MRQERTIQATTIRGFCRARDRAARLKAISQWLDRQSALVSMVAGDLRRHGVERESAAAEVWRREILGWQRVVALQSKLQRIS